MKLWNQTNLNNFPFKYGVQAELLYLSLVDSFTDTYPSVLICFFSNFNLMRPIFLLSMSCHVLDRSFNYSTTTFNYTVNLSPLSRTDSVKTYVCLGEGGFNGKLTWYFLLRILRLIGVSAPTTTTSTTITTTTS